ncbi:hypothetical protein PROFUN_05277 [Planoprotostelium fungivorum]|uniref:DUF962 domain-containing protein n=1 Tax=Planoprotostelium fungivorum TaxID=1890364 RepID=A0A2P6NRB2_9EUKA|nr:hypothetical protein PROFUN_05277 [Planoprotostelium fungivorum]
MALRNHAATASKLDLVEQAAIYGSYHNNKYNRLVHLVFVPCIVYAFTLWLAFLPLRVEIPFLTAINPSAFYLSAAHIYVAIQCGYYAILDPIVAGVLTVLFGGFAFHGQYIIATYGLKTAFIIGLILQILGWGAQIAVGHAIFEKRRPAITDSLFQAFVSPYFMAAENMFALGYKPELAKRIDDRTEELLKEYRASLKKAN